VLEEPAVCFNKMMRKVCQRLVVNIFPQVPRDQVTGLTLRIMVTAVLRRKQ